ncbi:hypothetical protein [Pontibacter beigongshangensis]|uniref:hypothetical protein n=1 Tax=Pontibacter beigongshangensis TaxID=2574733 RepID=UPI00164F6416|nr:hypothetical protein [Pontibacter beigongshangensis]
MMAAPAPQEFFRVNRTASEIKAEIFRQFFPAWCRLQSLAPEAEALVYVDLLAVEQVQQEPDAQQEQVRLFSNIEPNQPLRLFFGATSRLEQDILKQQSAIPVSENGLPYPTLLLQEPENQLPLSELLASGYPALVVSDPLATPYAQQLFLESSKTQSADLLLLLHPKKLRAAFTGKKTPAIITELFSTRLAAIQDFCRREKSAQGQEAYLVTQLGELLREQGRFTLDFRVDAPDKDQTSLYLLFASRSVPVYKAFKAILLPYSDYQQDGVPLFGANLKQVQQLALFPEQLRYSVQKLAEDLAQNASQYNYKTIEKIAEDHHPGTHYIKENYRLAIEKLRDQGKAEILNPKTLQTVRKATLASPVKFKQQEK